MDPAFLHDDALHHSASCIPAEQTAVSFHISLLTSSTADRCVVALAVAHAQGLSRTSFFRTQEQSCCAKRQQVEIYLCAAAAAKSCGPQRYLDAQTDTSSPMNLWDRGSEARHLRCSLARYTPYCVNVYQIQSTLLTSFISKTAAGLGLDQRGTSTHDSIFRDFGICLYV